MASPAGVTEGYAVVAFGRRGRGGICVGLFVVMVRKMVVGLYSVGGVRVVGDAMIAGAVQIFEAMEGGFVMLMRRSLVVRGKEGKDGGYVGTRACG